MRLSQWLMTQATCPRGVIAGLLGGTVTNERDHNCLCRNKLRVSCIDSREERVGGDDPLAEPDPVMAALRDVPGGRSLGMPGSGFPLGPNFSPEALEVTSEAPAGPRGRRVLEIGGIRGGFGSDRKDCAAGLRACP